MPRKGKKSAAIINRQQKERMRLIREKNRAGTSIKTKEKSDILLKTKYETGERDGTSLKTNYETEERGGTSLKTNYETEERGGTSLKTNYETEERGGTSLKTNYETKERDGTSLKTIYEIEERGGTSLKTNYETEERSGTSLKTNYETKERRGTSLKTNYGTEERGDTSLKTNYETEERGGTSLKTNYETEERGGSSLKTNYETEERGGTSLKTNYETEERGGSSLKTNYETEERDGTSLKTIYDIEERGGTSLKTNYETEERSGTSLKTNYEKDEKSGRPLQTYFETKKSGGTSLTTNYETEERSGTSLKTNYETKERRGTSLKTNYGTEERGDTSLKTNYETEERGGTSLKTNYETEERGGSSLKTNYETEERGGTSLKTNYETEERGGSSLKTNYETEERDGTSLKTIYDIEERGGTSLKTNYETEERSGTSLKTNYEKDEKSGRPLQTYFETKKSGGTSLTTNYETNEIGGFTLKTNIGSEERICIEVINATYLNNMEGSNENRFQSCIPRKEQHNRKIIQGNFHQGDFRFGNNMGKQCVGNSLAAVVYSRLKNVDDWDQSDLDNILIVGDEIYTHIHGDQDYLLVTELPEMVEIFDILVKCKRKDSIMAIQNQVQGVNLENFLALPLDEALQESLVDSDGCFICVMENTFMILKNNEKLYVFDSHSRNRLGLQDPDGSSIVLEMDNINDVYQHCLHIFPGITTPGVMFEVTGITVQLDITRNGDEIMVNNRNFDIPLSLSNTDHRIVDDEEIIINDVQLDRSLTENDLTQEKMDYAIDHMVSIEDDGDTDVCMDDIEIMSDVLSTMYDFEPLDIPSRKRICSILKIPTTYISKTNSLIVENMGPPKNTQSITSDGNCLFRALSYSISQRQKHHDKIRKAIVNHTLSNSEKFKSFLEPQYRNVFEHVSSLKMSADGSWGTALEIVAAADLFKTDIFTFFEGRWIKYSTKQVCNTNVTTNTKAIYLKHVGVIDHYEVVNGVTQSTTYPRNLNDTQRNTFLESTLIEKENKLNKTISTAPQIKRQKCVEDNEWQQDMTYTANEQHADYNGILLRKSEKEKLKYQSCSEFRKRKLSLSKEKYESDDWYREQKIKKNMTDYAENVNYRKNLIKTGVDKYASNKEYRTKLMKASVEKYSNNDEFRTKLMKANVEKYSNNDEFRTKLMKASVEKYSNNDEFRTKLMKASVDKYCNNKEHRENVIKAGVDKYAKNKEYQSYIKEQTKTRRLNIKEKNKDINFVIERFTKEAKMGPEYVCSCCFKLCFENQVMPCNRSTYTDQSIAETYISEKYLHKCGDDCNEKCTYLGTCRTELWICYNCHRKVQKGKIPAESFANNLELEDLPKEMKCLNSLEQHLIALHIPFMKILGLPKGGQKGVHGPVVCVPSDIKQTTTLLPRSGDDDLLLRVKLKRKISYKGYEEYQFVNTKHLEEALFFLKKRNKWYSQVEINGKWLNPIQEVSTDEENSSEPLLKTSEIERKKQIENSEIESIKQIENLEIESKHHLEEQEQYIDAKEDSYLDDKLRGVQLDSCLQPADIGQEALDLYFDQVFNLSPAEGNNPVLVLKEEGIEAKAFPVHYPSGKNAMNEERVEKLSVMRYFNLRLTSVENRFARDTAYIFFSQYLSELDRVMSNVQISLRKGSAYSADGKKITSQMLCEKNTLNGLLKNDEAIKYLKPVRGTPSYWQATQKDIFAMIRQLGIPTFFCSFSSADFRWTEIIETILKQQGDTRKFEGLSWNDKCDILRSNPVTAARMFDHRFHKFLNTVILSDAKPIGKVIDYFYRVEFQQRGSPHTHCLFWVEEAPKFDEDSDENVIEFIDKYITCEIPDENEDPELYEIVTSVHQHSKNHSKTCRKKGTVCRFNFPRPPSNKTFILRQKDEDENDLESGHKPAKEKLSQLWNEITNCEDKSVTTNELLQKVGLSQQEFEKCLSLVAKKNTVELKRKPNEIFSNQYNPHLLRAWNANTDIQFVLDAYSCVVYILSYISKSERELGLLLQQTRNEAREGNLDAQQTMKRVGTAYLHHREISAQEAVFRVIGLRLKECSRKVQFVPVGKNPRRMSIPLKQIQNKKKYIRVTTSNENNASDDDENDEEKMWMTNTIERYKARPQNDILKGMCLAQFCSEFNVLSESQVPGKINEETTFYLGKDLGYIRRRTRTSPAVIRYPRFSVESASEDYYQSMLQLFLPYHNDDQLKPHQFESFENFYHSGFAKLGNNNIVTSVKSVVDGNRLNFVKNEKALVSAEKQLNEQEPPEDAWGQLCPESEVERRECINEGSTFTAVETEEAETAVPDINNGNNSTAGTNLLTTSGSYNEIVPLMRCLNDTQRRILYKVRDWCIRKANGHNPDSFHVLITGGAGTGKSHLVKCIRYEARRILAKTCENPDDITVILTAPTGTAAFNIEGMTIHGAFGIFKTLAEEHATLGEDKINTLRSKLENLQILIIDEISMVNKRLLYFVHERLRQIKKVKEDCLFGGISVIAVGDFYQLPPVKSRKVDKLYVNDESNPLNHLWHGLFSIVELTEVMRQREDGLFAQLLNRIRIKQKNDSLPADDIEALKQCFGDGPDEALHIFPTNKEVQSFNHEMLIKLCTEPKLIEAQDFVKNKTTGTLTKRKTHFHNADICLEASILLSEGARVMLTKNQDTNDGLVNGVIGTVIRITKFTSGVLPRMIYVKFDNDKVGKNSKSQTIINNFRCVGLEPSKEEIPIYNAVRKQFPLKLAWACTVHKVQGLTVTECVLDLNKCFTYGQAYVALSRVTSKTGLHIMEIDESKLVSKIYCDPDIEEGIKGMKPFLSENIDIHDSRLTIMYHNIQGLYAHIVDLERNPDFIQADYICLTETWLKPGSRSFQLNYFEFKHLPRSEAFDTSSTLYASLKEMEHGGVGVFYKESSSFHDFKCPAKNLECILFSIPETGIIVATVYRTQTYNLQEFMDNFKKTIVQLSHFSNRIIVLGDFNQNILEGELTVANFMEKCGYTQHVHDRTTEADTIIDHVYVKGIPDILVTVMPTYYSFHEAVRIVIDRDAL